MSADLLREAAEQARAMAETHRTIAPTLADLYDGDDCDSLAAARRHDAVADWLEEQAGSLIHGFDPDDCPTCRSALAVATAYLGNPT